MESEKVSTIPTMPQEGFVRLPQIVGDKDADPPVPAIIPVSPSHWWDGIQKGIYPKPVKLSKRVTAWDVNDIRELIKAIKATALILIYVLFI